MGIDSFCSVDGSDPFWVSYSLAQLQNIINVINVSCCHKFSKLALPI